MERKRKRAGQKTRMKFSTLIGICSNFPIRNREKVRTLKATRNKRLLLALYAFGLMSRSNSRGKKFSKDLERKMAFFRSFGCILQILQARNLPSFSNPSNVFGIPFSDGSGGKSGASISVGVAHAVDQYIRVSIIIVWLHCFSRQSPAAFFLLIRPL